MNSTSKWFCVMASIVALSGCDSEEKEKDGLEGLEVTEAQCKDNIDNDGDKQIDCFDSDCSAFIFCVDDGVGDTGSDGDTGPDLDADTDADSDSAGDVDSDSGSDNQSTCVKYDGVDILVVIDNSGSMAEEQQLLSTGFYTLINSLTQPVGGWAYDAVENVRLAVVTSDMGLQYGEERETSSGVVVASCEDLRGDDGELLSIPVTVTVIDVASGVIACDGVEQCPTGFGCQAGACTAPGGVTTVNCPWGGSSPPVAEVGEGDSISDFATGVACMAQQGTGGCGVEQQLEASVRGFERNATFISDTHLLAVMIVTDEEDCSVASKSLYETDEWLSGPEGFLNTACNYPPENEDFLFSPGRYVSRWTELKDGADDAVVFAAIVGVPIGETCEGPGDQIEGCLDAPDMALYWQTFTTPYGEYIHFAPACMRLLGDVEITAARPGRRFVKVAQEIGENAYVASICNADWNPAMEEIAGIVARQVSKICE